jgi:putative flavoprotein involved in K+ transport
MSTPHETNTVVIGAGQAGLAVSRWLQKHDVSHVVLERDRVGHSWREQRWDSFRLNTPNMINLLPGDEYDGDDPLGFVSAGTLVNYLEEYARRHGLPIEEGVRVKTVRRHDDGFTVETDRGRWRSRNVVLCCGDQNRPQTPGLAARMPEDIVQLHTADYRRPDQLPAGAVLVVGSGQSGVQIAEDLVDAGRTVYLCTSAVGRMPRRYRGKDFVEWMLLARLGEQCPADLENPDEVYAPQPQTSGTRGGHTVCLQQLARDGVNLLGRLAGVRGRVLEIADDLGANIARGDEVSDRLKALVDMLIDRAGVDAPRAEPDPVEAPFAGIAEMESVRELDMDRKGIRSIIWATGFGPDHGFLDPALLNERGRLRHDGGVCDVSGLYCLGFVWLRRRFSGLVAGVAADAEHVASHILRRNAGQTG